MYSTKRKKKGKDQESIHTHYYTGNLIFTNFPSPVNRVKGMPPIGKADHDIVYVEYDIKAKRLKQASRKIYLYKRADMVGLKDHMTQFKDAYLSEDHSHMSVNDMWVKFKTGFVEASSSCLRINSQGWDTQKLLVKGIIFLSTYTFKIYKICKIFLSTYTFKSQ